MPELTAAGWVREDDTFATIWPTIASDDDHVLAVQR
jgi:hypothetical protein